MALVLADRVEQVTRTTGLADLTLAEVIRGRQSFQDVTNNGDTVIYVLEDAEGMNWEIGTGTVVHGAETTLQRTTIRQSSNGGSKISLSAGTHRVFLAADADYFDSIVTDADVAQAISDHEAEADPHPQYTTTAEASAAAPVQSVNGETGTVLLDAGDVGATPSSHVGSGGAQHADATTTVAGFMSGTDKTKLDTVETNAKDDQSAAEVPYTNTTSGLAATDVQAAIDEVDGDLDAHIAAGDPHPQYALEATLASNAAGSGSDDVAHTGTTQTVTEALNQRTIYVGSVAENFAGKTGTSGGQYSAIAWHAGGAVLSNPIGGGLFVFEAGRAKSDHNGATVISPTVPALSAQASISGFLSGAGETDPSGLGAFVRQNDGFVPFSAFGMGKNDVTLDNPAWQAMLDYCSTNSVKAVGDGPGYTYAITTSTGRSGTEIDLNGSTVRQDFSVTPAADNDYMIKVQDDATPTEGFKIYNGILDGDRDNPAQDYTALTTESVHLVRVNGAKDFTAKGLHLKRAKHDGLHFDKYPGTDTPPRDVLLKDIITEDSGRLGIQFSRVSGLVAKNIRGINELGAGSGPIIGGVFAMEAYQDGQLENIEIDGLYGENVQSIFGVASKQARFSDETIRRAKNITVSNVRATFPSHNGGVRFECSDRVEINNMILEYDSAAVTNNSPAIQYQSSDVTFNNVIIVNPDRAGIRAMSQYSASTSYVDSYIKTNNVTIINPIKRAVEVNDAGTTKVSGVVGFVNVVGGARIDGTSPAFDFDIANSNGENLSAVELNCTSAAFSASIELRTKPLSTRLFSVRGGTLNSVASTNVANLNLCGVSVISGPLITDNQVNRRLTVFSDSTGATRSIDLFNDQIRFFNAITASSASLETVFVDSATGKLSFKDSGGVTNALY